MSYSPACRLPDPDELRASEGNPEFERLRMNRKVMGAFRYGRFADPGKVRAGWDRVTAMQKKLDLYRQDRNKEHLVDLANYCELEFTEGDGIFQPSDDLNHCLGKA